MMKPKMIEKITDLYCANNHSLEPYMVVFDPKLQQKERILCTKCMDEYDNITKMITFKKAQQMIEENQTRLLELLENAIQPNIKQVELLQKHLDSLKSQVNQELDQFIENTKEWIKSFGQIRQLHTDYSFFKELEKLIQNKKIQDINESSFKNEITQINQAFIAKMNSKLQQFINFNEQMQCTQILNNIRNCVKGTSTADSEQSQIVQQLSTNPKKKKKVDQNENKEDYESELNQIEYMVYEDFSNFVNLLYSLKAVKEHFKEQPNHPMIVLSRNKVIGQLNLSNTIHIDLMSQYKNNLKKVLKERENVKNIINQFRSLLGDEYLQHIDYFISNSLNEKLSITNLNKEKVDESNSENLNLNLFGQPQETKQFLSHWVESKTYYSKTFDSFIFNAICYKQMTEIKLISNFPVSSLNPNNQ